MTIEKTMLVVRRVRRRVERMVIRDICLEGLSKLNGEDKRGSLCVKSCDVE